MDKASENQDSLFAGFGQSENISDIKLADAEPASQSAKLIWEKDYLDYIFPDTLLINIEMFLKKDSRISIK